jgi:DNA-3-methyladenine glycosylase
MRLKYNFFNRPTVKVARDLLGKYLCRKIDGEIIKARIIETEAYCGVSDLACHASKGLTSRTKIMFGPPAHAYVYMIYGMYHCLNFVTEEEGNPSAVLIRGIEGISGPGKLCRELKIDRTLNGVDVLRSEELWVESGREGALKIKKGKRIGVDYAGKWKDKLWRFWI